MEATRPTPSLVLAAYAQSFAEGRRVVIFGDCTSGLAETLIERGARLVHVYDADLSRVTEAAARGSLPSVAYAPLGQSGVVTRDGTFDLGIIENLAASDDSAGLLARLRRALAARGVAFVATPNLEVEPLLLADPEHTESGPSYYDLFELVSAQFSEVRMVGQTPFVGYALAEFGADAGNQFSIDTGFVPGGAEEPEWYLAAAGHFPLTLDAFSVIQLPAEDVLNASNPLKSGPPSLGVSREHELLQLKQELEKRDAWASELEARASAADERADQSESRVEALEAELDSLKAEVARMRSQAQQERERNASAAQQERDRQTSAAQQERDRQASAAQQERDRQASAAQASTKQREQEFEKRARAEQSASAAQKSELEAALNRRTELEAALNRRTELEAAQKAELEAALSHQAELESALKRAQSQLERAEATARQREADATKQRAQDVERKKDAEAAQQRDREAADVELLQLREVNAELQADLDRLEEQLRERGRAVEQVRLDMHKTEQLARELLAELEDTRDKSNGVTRSASFADVIPAVSIAAAPPESPRLAELEQRIGELARIDALRVADLTAAQWSVQELETKLQEAQSTARSEAEHLRHELQAKSALLEQLNPGNVEA